MCVHIYIYIYLPGCRCLLRHHISPIVIVSGIPFGIIRSNWSDIEMISMWNDYEESAQILEWE